MKKAAFAFVAVLAVVALLESNLLSQAARDDIQEDFGFGSLSKQTVRDQLVANYVQLTQELANEMSVEELERAIVNTEREIALRKADEVFDPVIAQLRAIADEKGGKVVRQRAAKAILTLQGRDGGDFGPPLEEVLKAPSP